MFNIILNLVQLLSNKIEYIIFNLQFNNFYNIHSLIHIRLRLLLRNY
jgi:hypothetical protein